MPQPSLSWWCSGLALGILWLLFIAAAYGGDETMFKLGLCNALLLTLSLEQSLILGVDFLIPSSSPHNLRHIV